MDYCEYCGDDLGEIVITVDRFRFCSHDHLARWLTEEDVGP